MRNRDADGQHHKRRKAEPLLPHLLLRALPVAAAIALAGAPALAQNWLGLMRNTPAERFNDEDMRLFNDSLDKALGATPAGQSVRWENPKSENRGEIKVVKTFTWQEHACRELRITNQSGDRKGDSLLNLCRVDDKWRAVSPSELKR
jgi:surface antigen